MLALHGGAFFSSNLQLLLFTQEFFALHCGLWLTAAAALVRTQRRFLAVGLPTDLAGVGPAACVHHLVLVEAGVLREALSTARHRAGIWLLPCVNPYVVLVIGDAGEAPSTHGLWTRVGTLACVRSDVNPEDVGGGKRAVAVLKWALEGTHPCVCPDVFL